MVTSYMPSYLQEIIKLDSTTVSFLITIVMAIMIPLALMFGRVADKIGEKKVFLIGLIGTALFSVIAITIVIKNETVVLSSLIISCKYEGIYEVTI